MKVITYVLNVLLFEEIHSTNLKYFKTQNKTAKKVSRVILHTKQNLLKLVSVSI